MSKSLQQGLQLSTEHDTRLMRNWQKLPVKVKEQKRNDLTDHCVCVIMKMAHYSDIPVSVAIDNVVGALEGIDL
jgi:hypothetical protein